ncbi:related to Don3 interacting protein [Ustilago trichophora]|uniref:Related to Don3 interacting protein n=1 Tax=Ustilago trichophora TaxID=86804 RepID=A0A5C3ECM5_9BASI|nr:related to Don3 interacting protein [Ustilago trichophora]
MFPPIISQSSTPTQSRFSTAKDHLSPGVSRPNTMSPRAIDFESTIEDWIDGLTSPLSTSSERISILNDIEKTLVKITSAGRTIGLPGLDQASTFWALQAAAGFSLAEVLLAHVYRLHLELERECESNKTLSEAESGSSHTLDSVNVQGLGLGVSSPTYRISSSAVSGTQGQRIHTNVSEICIAITILQGLTLCSKPSKRITSRKSALELLLAIILADYCTQLLPPILCPSPPTPTSPAFPLAPHSPSTPNTSSPSKKPSESSDAPLSLPSGFALDLLMCILVDSRRAQDRFSDMGGIHQIVQLSHKCADMVTTPASTPTSANFAESTGKSSHIVALKQTDLLCLEFRYFWSQILQGGTTSTRVSDELVGPGSAATSFYSVQEEVGNVTPKASPRKRASRLDLREKQDDKVVGDTPKANGSRKIRRPVTARATSEEAPSSRPSFSSSSRNTEAANAESSPGKLRHSRSNAELRKKPTPSSSKSSIPPLPPMPLSDSPQSIKSEVESCRSRQMQRLSTSETQLPTSISQPESKEGAGIRVRRSTVSTTDQDVRNFQPSRPGMSSRDRPRIPSPLKPRTPAQEASEQQTKLLLRQEAMSRQQAITYRRLRSSTASTPFSSSTTESSSPRAVGERVGRSRDVVLAAAAAAVEGNDGDGENRNPFTSSSAIVPGDKGERMKQSSPFDSVSATPRSTTTMMGSSESRSNLASVRIPPSPAVRRAQLARARSLSPTKLSLPSISGSGERAGIHF